MSNVSTITNNPTITSKTRLVEKDEKYPTHLIEMYKFMERYRKKNGFVPSNREMVEEGYGSSTSVIRYYYDRMEEFGMIQCSYKIARGICLFTRDDWHERRAKKNNDKEIRNGEKKN
jgi:hypothetical protein